MILIYAKYWNVRVERLRHGVRESRRNITFIIFCMQMKISAFHFEEPLTIISLISSDPESLCGLLTLSLILCSKIPFDYTKNLLQKVLVTAFDFEIKSEPFVALYT